MNPYIKIKESPPFYIGRLTLETKGIGKRIFHQIMFPKQLPSNSLGMVSLKVHVDFRSRHSTPYLNLEKAIKKMQANSFSRESACILAASELSLFRKPLLLQSSFLQKHEAQEPLL